MSSSSPFPTTRNSTFGRNLTFEMIILELIESVSLTMLRIEGGERAGDAKAARASFVMGVMNLDNLVTPILHVELSKEESAKYERRRKQIRDTWPQDPTKDGFGDARELYSLIIEQLADQKLFKIKKFESFGAGWRKSNEPDLKQLDRIEDEQDED